MVIREENATDKIPSKIMLADLGLNIVKAYDHTGYGLQSGNPGNR